MNPSFFKLFTTGFCRMIRKVSNTSLESPRQVFFFQCQSIYSQILQHVNRVWWAFIRLLHKLKKKLSTLHFFSLLHVAFDHKKEYERKENYRTTTTKKKTELKVNSEKAESMGSRGRLYVWKVTSEAQWSSSSWNQRLAVEAAPEHWLKPDTALPLLWVSCSGLVRSPG